MPKFNFLSIGSMLKEYILYISVHMYSFKHLAFIIILDFTVCKVSYGSNENRSFLNSGAFFSQIYLFLFKSALENCFLKAKGKFLSCPHLPTFCSRSFKLKAWSQSSSHH
jgi:hypothetical protein